MVISFCGGVIVSGPKKIFSVNLYQAKSHYFISGSEFVLRQIWCYLILSGMGDPTKKFQSEFVSIQIWRLGWVGEGSC